MQKEEEEKTEWEKEKENEEVEQEEEDTGEERSIGGQQGSGLDAVPAPRRLVLITPEFQGCPHYKAESGAEAANYEVNAPIFTRREPD